MKSYQVTIKQDGRTRKVTVIAKCSIDALTNVMQSINSNTPSRVIARLA